MGAVQQDRAGDYLWHPFSNMGEVALDSVVVERGEGYHVFDADGRRYIDATASLWYANVGYGRTEIADAVARQLRQLPAYSTFGHYANRTAIDLAKVLTGLVPVDNAVVFFTSGGSDGVDTASKLARLYWSVMGRSEKRALIARERGYHGMNGFGTSLAGIPSNNQGYGPMVEHTHLVPYNDPDALADMIGTLGSERVAAFFVEPVIGAGGVIPPSEGYLQRAEQICRENDVMFVVDEVVTGFGRLGEWFGSDRYDIRPDMLIGAKGLTSGYLPLGMVAVAGWVADPFWQHGTQAWFRHGYTYSGHAAACAAGLANLDIIRRENLVDQVALLEPVLTKAISRLAAHPVVGEVRTVGLLAAVDLNEEVIAEHPQAPMAAVNAARAAGVLTRVIGGTALQVSPPFVITPEGITALTDGLLHALDALGSPQTARAR